MMTTTTTTTTTTTGAAGGLGSMLRTRPRDSSADFSAEIEKQPPVGPVSPAERFQGGAFVSDFIGS